MSDLITMKKTLEQRLVHIKGVVGVGADPSRGVILVYVEDESVIPRVRPLTARYPVEFKVVGRVSVA